MTREGAFTYPITPDAPGKPGTKGPTASRRRGPQHEANEPSKPARKKTAAKAAKAGEDMISRIRPEAEGLAARRRAPKAAPKATAEPRTAPIKAPPARSRSRATLREAGQEANEYAIRQAVRASTSKPSVTGRAVSGGAAGAATGAALGGPVGAVAGGAVGGTAGAISGASAKRAYKKAMRAGDFGARKAVVAEFTICLVIAALSPLTDRRREEPPGAWMRRMSAIMGVFFVLGLMSTGGRGLSRFAAGFGGLVTVALVVSERDLFVTLARIFGAPSGGIQTMGSAPEPGEGDEPAPVTQPDPRRWQG